MSKTVWEKLNDSQKDELMQFNKEYIDFLSVSKTERAFVNNSIALVEKAGFKAGDKSPFARETVPS